MKRSISLYKDITAPWICAAVYLWALELRAVVGTDSEPITAWLADCAAILLTLVFWICVASLPVVMIVALSGSTKGTSINRFLARSMIVGITAMHFVRWLLSWQFLGNRHDWGLIVLVVTAAVLLIFALIRRGKNISQVQTTLPTLEDCFLFGAVPVLVIAVLFIGAGIARERTLTPSHSAALATDSLSETDRAGRPSIILVVSDALRAQSMSLYGRARTTTPELDRWAQTATVFLEAHSNSTSTKPSMTTILTGKHPLSHGRLTKGQPPYRSRENLLQVMRDNGYYVGAVTSNEDASLRLLGFNPSLSENEMSAFESLSLSWLRQYGIHPTPTGGRMYQNLAQYLWFLGYPQRTSYYGFAEDTVSVAENFVRHTKQPFFLLIHMHEPHDPYETSPDFRGSYSGNLPANFQLELPSSYYARYDPKLQPSANYYRDQYEESIRYLDSQLGKFFRVVENLMSNRSSAIIFTGDHGESFDRGYMNHGEDLFETSTHVPLMIRFPSQSHGVRFSGLVESADIAPTILSVAGITRPLWMDGRTLERNSPPSNGDFTFTLNYRDPVGQSTFELPTKAALWWQTYKLIRACDSGQVMLYNLKTDPGENVDISKSLDSVSAELDRKLQLVLDKQINGPKISCHP